MRFLPVPEASSKGAENLFFYPVPLASAMLEEAGGNLAAPPSPSKTRRPPASILHMPTSSVKGRSYSSLVASEPSAAPRASNADGGLTSPSVTVPPTNTTAADTFVIKRNGNGSKVVDETKPLHKNNPAPCNRFYLTPAGCAVPCNFCHEYQLTLAQMTTVSIFTVALESLLRLMTFCSLPWTQRSRRAPTC